MSITLREIYSKERINLEVRRLAREISTDYEGKELVALVILKGAFIFAADLIREITVPVTVDFLQISSYCGTDSTGKSEILKDAAHSLQGENVLIIEDIVDQGYCLSFLLEDLRKRNPSSLKVCTLIDNRKRRFCSVEADYAGIRDACGFLVGYGLDMDQRYRELPALYEVVTSSESD